MVTNDLEEELKCFLDFCPFQSVMDEVRARRIKTNETTLRASWKRQLFAIGHHRSAPLEVVSLSVEVGMTGKTLSQFLNPSTNGLAMEPIPLADFRAVCIFEEGFPDDPDLE